MQFSVIYKVFKRNLLNNRLWLGSYSKLCMQLCTFVLYLQPAEQVIFGLSLLLKFLITCSYVAKGRQLLLLIDLNFFAPQVYLFSIYTYYIICKACIKATYHKLFQFYRLVQHALHYLTMYIQLRMLSMQYNVYRSIRLIYFDSHLQYILQLWTL